MALEDVNDRVYVDRHEFEGMRSAIERLQLQANGHQTHADRIAISLEECKSALSGIRDRTAALSDRLATMADDAHKTATAMPIILEVLQAQSLMLDKLRDTMKVMQEKQPRRGPRVKHRRR